MSKNQELFSINLEQTKRITELEKQLQFWKDKVSQLFDWYFEVFGPQIESQHAACRRVQQFSCSIIKDFGNTETIGKQNLRAHKGRSDCQKRQLSIETADFAKGLTNHNFLEADSKTIWRDHFTLGQFGRGKRCFKIFTRRKEETWKDFSWVEKCQLGAAEQVWPRVVHTRAVLGSAE